MGKCSSLGVHIWTASELGIGEQILVITGGVLDAQVVGELPRCLGRPSGNAGDFYIAQTAQGFGVDPPHKANAKDCDFQFFHILMMGGRAPRGGFAPKHLFP